MTSSYRENPALRFIISWTQLDSRLIFPIDLMHWVPKDETRASWSTQGSGPKHSESRLRFGENTFAVAKPFTITEKCSTHSNRLLIWSQPCAKLNSLYRDANFRLCVYIFSLIIKVMGLYTTVFLKLWSGDLQGIWRGSPVVLRIVYFMHYDSSSPSGIQH